MLLGVSKVVNGRVRGKSSVCGVVGTDCTCEASANLALEVPPRLPHRNARVTYTVGRAVRERLAFSGLVEQFSDLVKQMFQHSGPRDSLGH